MREQRCDQLQSDLCTLVADANPENVAQLLLQQLKTAKDAWQSSERARQRRRASPLRESSLIHRSVS